MKEGWMERRKEGRKEERKEGRRDGWKEKRKGIKGGRQEQGMDLLAVLMEKKHNYLIWLIQ